MTPGRGWRLIEGAILLIAAQTLPLRDQAWRRRPIHRPWRRHRFLAAPRSARRLSCSRAKSSRFSRRASTTPHARAIATLQERRQGPRRAGLPGVSRGHRPATGRSEGRGSRHASRCRRGEPPRPLDAQDPLRACGASSWPRATWRQPRNWPGRRPCDCSPTLRKDRLAEVYHAFARRLLEPDDPVVQADPNGAWDLLSQARGLAKSPALRAQLLFSLGRTSQKAGNFPRAIENFQTYLKEYPQGADRLAARFHLGEAQRQANQLLQARLTWTDLAHEIDRLKPADLGKDAATIRASALAEIPSTYGVPAPPDDTSMNLGVAALERFLAAYPAHPRAVRAAYQIGASYLARGKSEQALAAFSRFLKEDGFKVETDEARRDQAELVMTATFQHAQILQGQQKFNEAIAAWKGYLANFPNGPQSADSQRAILDTQLLIAADHLARARYPEARAAWSEFVTQNPLDPRVPGLLLQLGQSFLIEKKFDEAIAAWGPLSTRFPTSEPAAHAQFLTASVFEIEKGDPSSRHRAIQEDHDRALAVAGPGADRGDGSEGALRAHPAGVSNR